MDLIIANFIQYFFLYRTLCFGMESRQRFTVHEIPPDVSTSSAVLDAVADVIDEEKLDLPPIHGNIDPDALDSLFEPATHSMKRIGRVEFPYAEFDIAIRFDDRRTITISEQTRTSLDEGTI